jgi:hypothetical protein
VYPEGYTGSSEEESEEDAPEPPRFVEGEVISDSAKSDEDSEEGEVSENDDLTAEERLGGRTTGQLANDDRPGHNNNIARSEVILLDWRLT